MVKRGITGVIRSMLEKIVEFVKYDEIGMYLFQEGAITRHEWEVLETEKTNTHKVCKIFVLILNLRFAVCVVLMFFAFR